MEKEEVRIIIPNFVKEITVSNSRRAKYYKKGEKVPKKYNPDFTNSYCWGYHKKYLVVLSVLTGQPIVKNPTTAGTPKKEQIAGNMLWDTNSIGNYLEIIKLTLQKYFWDVITYFKLDELRLNTFPIRITLEFHTYKEKEDTDNLHTFYEKAFIDAIKNQWSKPALGEQRVLLEERWIPDDSAKYIKSIHIEHNDCFKGEDKLVIIVTSGIANKVIDYDLEVKTLNLKLNA